MKKSFFFRLPCSILLAALTLGLTLAPLARAQSASQWWANDSESVDSSFWWTLSDRISPHQLRAALTDVEQHQLRYAGDNQRTGRQQPPEITIYIDGSAAPELIPAWRAFAAFAHRFKATDTWSFDPAGELRGYGVSEAGMVSILESVASLNLDENTLKGTIWPRWQEFGDELKKALQVLGSLEAVEQLVESGDFSTLSEITGRSIRELRGLQSNAIRSPMVEAAVPIIQTLRADLSETDWQRLRGYLLADVATGIRVSDMKTANPGVHR